MVASDTTQTYHVAVVGYLACGLVLTTSSVNSLVYSANGAKEAASAGFILLSMVTVRGSQSPLHVSDDKTSRIICLCRRNLADQTMIDCVDLLFRLRAFGCPAGLPRLVCVDQGVAHDEPTDNERLWWRPP